MSSQNNKRVMIKQQSQSNKSRYSYHYGSHLPSGPTRPVPPTSLHPIIATKSNPITTTGRKPPSNAETYDNLRPDLLSELELPSTQFATRLTAYKAAYAPSKDDADAHVKHELQQYYDYNLKYHSGSEWKPEEEEKLADSLEWLLDDKTDTASLSGGIYKTAGVCISSGRTTNAIRVHVHHLASQKNKSHSLHSRFAAISRKLKKEAAPTANDTCYVIILYIII